MSRLWEWERRRAERRRAAERIARRARPPLPPLEDGMDAPGVGGLTPMDARERELDNCPAEFRGYFPDADQDT